MKCYYHFLYCLVCLSIYTAAQPSTEIGYSTTTSPDFYKDEEITFTCEATGYANLRILQLRYEADGDSEIYRSGCSRSAEDDTVWISVSTPDITGVPEIGGPRVSNADCNSVGKPEGFSLSVQLTVTDSTLKGKFYCRGFEGGGVGEILSSEVSVEVKVAPTSISLNKPENIIEGEKFTFDCNSTGADPVSVYEYRVNGNTVAGKYTPTEIDRAGLTLSCTDTEHSNWKGGNTEQTVTITPQSQPYTEIEYSTTTSPDFYQDEKITFTCKASGYTDLRSFRLRYEADGDSTVYRSGCGRSPEDDTVWEGSSTPDIITVSGIEGPGVSSAYCNSVGKPEGFTLSVQLTITDSIHRGKFYCRGFEGGRVEEFLSSEVSMKVKAAPTRISMNTPENIVEGDEFSFDCNSTGAHPVSVYEYKVNGNTVAGKYTPTETDRAGLTLSCTDTEHSNWKGGNTEQTATIIPQYLAKRPGVQDPIIEEFNPEQSDVKLKCSQHVDANPPLLTFTWTYNGALIIGTADELALNSKTDGLTDTVSCTAGNGLSKSVTITWTIKWDSSITLSTTIPITTLSETSPCAGINRAALGGGLAGGCLLLIITAGVAFHLGKLKGIRSQARTCTDNSPYTELSVTRISNSPYAELSVTRTNNSTYTKMSVTRMDDHNYDSLDTSQRQTANTDNDEAPSGQTYVNIRS